MISNPLKKVSQAIQDVLTKSADKLARSTNFIKRQVKVKGSNFSQTLVFGWLSNPSATLEELTQTGVAIGLEISPQALDQRFTKEAADFMQEVLNETASQVITADPVAIPILQRFNGVYIQDSSTITLPDSLSQVWSGCGQGVAALKMEVRWDLLAGTLDGPFLHDGRTNDRRAAQSHSELPTDSLSMGDLGYWKLSSLEELSLTDRFWLSRPQIQTAIFDKSGERYQLTEIVVAQSEDSFDLDIELGVNHRLPARLIGVRVPQQVASKRRRKLKKEARDKGKTVSKARLALCNWTLLVTNIPRQMLSIEEALVLAKIRWQIELLFKLWKSVGQVDKSRSQNKWRILCEIYGKLIGQIIQHWAFLIGNWQFPDRSFTKAAATVQQHALGLAIALTNGLTRLQEALTILARCLAAGCRINKSVKTPRTYQLLLALEEL